MTVSTPKQTSRITLRQLCSLGLPAPIVLPSLLPAVRQVVAASHAAFFYCDDEGNITNLYAEHMLPPDAMAHYHEHHYRKDIGAFAQAYLARVRAASPVSSRSIGAEEKQSAYYREVMAVLRIEHILYGIVRSPKGRVLGQLSVYRDAASQPFDAADVQALQEVLHYLGAALAMPAPSPLQSIAADTAEEALAVLNAEGEVIYADANFTRLIRMARGDVISPAQAVEEAAALPPFIKALMAATAATRQALHLVDSAWGRFAFRQHVMSSGAGASAVGLMVSRLAAEPLQMTESVSTLGLPPQQREVALMLTLGHSNAEIAERLGVSVNTANYHVKQVFARLNVHERHEVAQALKAHAASRL